jgi:hypothetical protein
MNTIATGSAGCGGGDSVAWFRMMGIDSVEYHRRTVLDRGDDHQGQALAYYGSRGETPLQWGGLIADRLGLTGAVDEASYEASALAEPATPILGHGSLAPRALASSWWSPPTSQLPSSA